jgi:hypothetical protein
MTDRDLLAESGPGPALRTCLAPTCLAQYDAIAALTGVPPAQPEWSSEGWRIISGMPFPAAEHVCPAHVDVVTTHFPRRASTEKGWVRAACACGAWTSCQRWHGAVRALWEEHLLEVLGAFDVLNAASQEETGDTYG